MIRRRPSRRARRPRRVIRPTGGTAIYLYALVESGNAPALGRAPAGLPGLGRPRALHAGGRLWLVAADAPLPEYGGAPIERGLRDLGWVSTRAVAHAAVVEHAARRRPAVPLKLFTLFRSDARAVEHVTRRRRRLERVLRRVAGCREWGVRVVLDPTRARAAAPGRRPRRALGAGTRFLLERRGEGAALRRLGARAAGEASRLFRRLATRARDARRRPPPTAAGGPLMLLDAAFLVPVSGTAGFRAAVREGARALAARGCAVVLTGPWPPYHFVGERP